MLKRLASAQAEGWVLRQWLAERSEKIAVLRLMRSVTMVLEAPISKVLDSWMSGAFRITKSAVSRKRIFTLVRFTFFQGEVM